MTALSCDRELPSSWDVTIANEIDQLLVLRSKQLAAADRQIASLAGEVEYLRVDRERLVDRNRYLEGRWRSTAGVALATIATLLAACAVLG